MRTPEFTSVERAFTCNIPRKNKVNIPYITVENFPKLGLLTALRFLEWVSENPNGVISLPTGKTPEHFIAWTRYLLNNWDETKARKFREQYGLNIKQKPEFGNLHFVQIDEFYPINSAQHNSFYHYVKKFYIEGFGLDESKAILINCDDIKLAQGKHYNEVFPSGAIDLSLRSRTPKSKLEILQQQSLFLIDNWCVNYEKRIRALGGIGFFLGGIGPDGHIGFNTRGSDPHSSTRLTATNFETQAAAAGDLGGIEISQNKLVITLGLGSISYNPNVTAIIFAAGESKAPMVRDALEKEPSNLYPASVLSELPNARFYITRGAAVMLKDSVDYFYKASPWNQEKTDRAVIDLCKKINKYADKLTLEDLKEDDYCQLIPDLDHDTVQTVITSVESKIEKVTQSLSNQVFYHTSPHHDDILLGLLPHIHRLSRNETNQSHFAIMTSGFTAVTNNFLISLIKDTISFLEQDLIQMVEYPDFFESGYRYKRDKDVYHYLIKVASGHPEERQRAFSHRLVRDIIEFWEVKNKEQLRNQLQKILSITRNRYDGEEDHPKIQMLKGAVREFEDELVWACFGMRSEDIHHLRLGFYNSDSFTEKIKQESDVESVIQQFRTIQPTVVSLAFDPEGNGPGTHYKALQTIAEALREWGKSTDLKDLKIWGYRNVWHRFHPSEASHIVPVSLNAMSIMDSTYTNSYRSQVDASFPSYMLDGKFSDLSMQIWVEQLQAIQLLLGKPFFYQNESPRLRTTHGLLYFKEMTVNDFLEHARELEKSMEGSISI
ncbi:MAG: hypothetical protein PHE03_05200 [Bacteroidales bacterium]|nr:hypothetical protein [Bacteroidales bacterium]MDD3891682.1 hypothetical protein [Bacteroidales bacterium]